MNMNIRLYAWNMNGKINDIVGLLFVASKHEITCTDDIEFKITPMPDAAAT